MLGLPQKSGTFAGYLEKRPLMRGMESGIRPCWSKLSGSRESQFSQPSQLSQNSQSSQNSQFSQISQKKQNKTLKQKWQY